MSTLQENQSLNAEYERNKKEREMKEEIKRLNNIIKQQDTRNSRQRIANRELLERNQDLVIENLKSNNIINELEKELKEDYKIWMCNNRSNGKSVQFGIDVCKTHFYNRLQELKGEKE